MIKLKLEANSIAELMEKMTNVMGSLQPQVNLGSKFEIKNPNDSNLIEIKNPNQLEIAFEEKPKGKVKTIKEVALPASPKVVETIEVKQETKTVTEEVNIDEIRTLQRSLIADYKETAIGFVKAKLEAFNAPSLSELNPKHQTEYFVALCEFSEAMKND